MNPDCPVMEPGGLFQESVTSFLPEDEVIEKGLNLHLNLVPVTAQVQVLLPKFTGPFPDVAEHLFVKAPYPSQGKRCRATRGLGGKVLHHDLADVLCFGPVQIRPGADSFLL